mmetsp:Transcript_20908/g.57978  ORF Transcript_20908/g.57978 Transcript_20908/m.57978 type:complete len:231 (+) Transcript_20908:96-788(+)
MGPVTHCLFDMDGLLLDTESFYTVVQQEILSKYGKTFTWELKAKMMGKKALDAAKILVDELDLSESLTPEEFVAMREQRLDEMFPTSQLLPGVERLILHLHSSSIPIAVATSSHRRHFDMKTTMHKELFSVFDHIVTGDMVLNGKPDPEIFQVCASKFKNPPAAPGCCLVFEDAPTGVAAGKSAGMQVVMVPDSRLDPSLSRQADVVLKSLEDFAPEEFSLPTFASSHAA